MCLVMADSLTLTLSEATCTLEAQYFPPIEISRGKNLCLGTCGIISVAPGDKIIEILFHISYLPVAVQSTHNFQLRIIDQNGHFGEFLW